ncbi:hypothetical protein L226DRAFT_615507 [Lentinus tigrinus ALCF2SS1-7]|uniref:Uncharacterized protein n=1 Tax=Lentinus tigrinus ALCF2SS1-6 TaxID=1328759 RepID=A0A5C2RZ61_9APHY|nr:hypothetical protein L227DRAFT_588071 [Lentinus tigrinus ALCF2SS1-6]RPD71499.1 hypothetical protein L226DRAFT_615507 [Lentinus tigrinus ALCF2SS1-7]
MSALGSDLTSDRASDSSSFKAIVAAIVTDTDPAAVGIPRSSGSLESNASTSRNSNTSTGSSVSAPSLDTSHSTDSTASAASSTNPSPCPSILIRSSSSLTVPGTRSGSSSPNISFAPLPQLEPRKRNSSRQLGIAARSQLLRHRRMLREQGYDPNSVPYPYGPGSGVEGGRGYAGQMEEGGPVEIREAEAGVDADEDMSARAHRSRALSDPSEDALVSLGKLMKGAGRALWKSMSMRDMRAKEKEEAAAAKAAEDGQDDSAGGHHGLRPRGGSLRGKTEPLPRNNAIHLFDHGQQHPPSAEGEGGVWEEEIPEESWKKLLSDAPATSEPTADDEASEHRLLAELARTESLRTSVVEVGSGRKSLSKSRTR